MRKIILFLLTIIFLNNSILLAESEEELNLPASKAIFPLHKKNYSLELFFSKLKNPSEKERVKLMKLLPKKMSKDEFSSLILNANPKKLSVANNKGINNLTPFLLSFSLEQNAPSLKYQNPNNSLKSHGFSGNTSLAIYRAVQNIREISSPEVLIIFIGRSPIWIWKAYQILESVNPLGCSFVHVHFSGKPDSMNYCNTSIDKLLTNLVTPDRLNFYRNYLRQKGIFPGMPFKELYLVDYVEEGEGVYQFSRILKEWFEDEEQPLLNLRILDMNISDLNGGEKEGFHKIYIQTSENIKSEFQVYYHCVNGEIDGENDYDDLTFNEAFGVYFPAFKWTKAYENEINNYEQDTETVHKRTNDLLNFYQTYIKNNPAILLNKQRTFDQLEKELNLKRF